MRGAGGEPLVLWCEPQICMEMCGVAHDKRKVVFSPYVLCFAYVCISTRLPPSQSDCCRLDAMRIVTI